MTTATSSRRSGKRTRAAAPDDPATAYARAVDAGAILAGRAVRLACRRHLQDLAEGPRRGLAWRPDEVVRAIEFFPTVLRLAEGQYAGQPFRLQPWQQFIIGSLFGWAGPDGYRRFRTGYVEAGKGAGKSPMAGGVGLYGLIEDGEPVAEIYAAAVQRDQARILWVDAKRMVAASPALSRQIEAYEHHLFHPATASVFRPVSAEARGLEGKRVHMALIDEVWAHADAEVIQAMRRGTKARRQGLIFEITNSGFDRQTICWQHHEYSRRVLEGVISNDAWFAYVCQLDVCDGCRADGHDQPVDGCVRCDQWTDERVWIKANPNLGVSLPAKYLRERVTEALGMPATQNEVQRSNFCIWTRGFSRWLDPERWAACPTTTPAADLVGAPCYAGLDLGQTDDFSAFVRVWTVSGRVVVRAQFWIPEAALRKHPGRPYAQWQAGGWLTVTEGDVVDYDQVEMEIAARCRESGVRELAYDKRFAAQMALHCEGQGIVCVDTPQGFQLNEALRKLAELVVKGDLDHGGHPVLAWMAANAVVRHGTRQEIRLDKDKAGEKIDGIAALAMALSRALVAENPTSVYATRGLLAL